MTAADKSALSAVDPREDRKAAAAWSLDTINERYPGSMIERRALRPKRDWQSRCCIPVDLVSSCGVHLRPTNHWMSATLR